MDGSKDDRISKILIIEDEPDQIKMVKLRLQASGYEVLAAETAQMGISLAQEQKPDLILLDMLLPDMDGLKVVEKLKEDTRTHNIPIMAVTAVGTVDIEEKSRDVGCNDFIRKPYDSHELVAKIKKLLEV